GCRVRIARKRRSRSIPRQVQLRHQRQLRLQLPRQSRRGNPRQHQQRARPPALLRQQNLGAVNRSVTTFSAFSVDVKRGTLSSRLIARSVFLLDPFERFFSIFQCAFQLSCFNSFQYFAERRTRFHSERDQIVTAHERRRNNRLIGEFLALPQKKIVVVHHPVTACAIDSMELELFLKRRSRHEPFQLRHPHSRHVLEHHMLTHHLYRGIDLRTRKAQTFHD